MPLAGNLRQYALTDVLRMIEHGQRSGVLTLVRGKLQASIYFSGGQWLLGERVGLTTSLVQQLVQAGYLSAEQFEMSTGVPFAQTASFPDMQMVRALIGAHVLTQEQLRAFRQDDACALLATLLSWPDGDFNFVEGIQLPSGRVALPLPVSALVNQALMQARSRGTLPTRDVVPLSPETVIAFADIDPDSGVTVQLTRDQWRLLTAVDGKLPLWAIIADLAAPEVAILHLAAELHAAGIVTVAGRISQTSR
ncbi:MAG: DUF4388 domain-containing protein [Ktedonobacterales bacterium]